MFPVVIGVPVKRELSWVATFVLYVATSNDPVESVPVTVNVRIGL